MARSPLTSSAIGDMRRLTGKNYPKLEEAFDALDTDGQRELVRFMADINAEIRQAERKAMMQPWRHGR